MKKFTFIFLLCYCLIPAQSGKSIAEIDHIPIVVKDLKSAEKDFKDAGFTIKPGRKHKNGLINSHIKFKDATALEIMSVIKNHDEITQGYLNFLQQGEGGTYLAVKISDVNETSIQLKKHNIKHRIIKSKLFTYIVFAEFSHKHIFLIRYHREFKEDSKYLSHSNLTSGINSVVISGDIQTLRLLEILFNGKSANNIVKTVNGKSVVVKIMDNDKLFRVLEVDLENFNHSATVRGLIIN